MNNDSETGISGSSSISHGSYQYIIDIQDPPTDRAYYYNAKIKVVLFHLSVTEWIPILLKLYNEKIFWIQLPSQFGLHNTNGEIIMKNNYFFQKEFFNIRVSCMLGILIIQRLIELIYP
jgi:hypothetical protein